MQHMACVDFILKNLSKLSRSGQTRRWRCLMAGRQFADADADAHALVMMLCAGDGFNDEYSNHAHMAYESGVLKALSQLGRNGQRAADALSAGLPSTVLLPLLAGMVAAFGLTPDRLPLEDLNHVLQLFSAIYEGMTEFYLHGSICLSWTSAH